MLTKKCAKCEEQKSIELFGRLSSSSDGLKYRCKPCIKIDKYEFKRKNPDRVKAYISNWMQKNPDKAKSGQVRRFQKWYKSNKDIHKKRVSNWFDNNPGVRNLYASNRRFRILNQSINLTDYHKRQIVSIYKSAKRITIETGIKHHVDHIFPLAGRNGCGLHVPWNLQIIPASENCSKGNKMPLDQANL